MIDRAVAQRIRLVGFDVDGTMTDGGVYLGRTASGESVELKRYDIQDGLSMSMLRRAGILVAMVTGRDPDVARLRADDLEADEFAGDASAHKVPLFEAILKKRGIAWEEAAFVGDDLPDIPILRRVGLPVAVANAVPEVKRVAAWTTTCPAGRGAIREFITAFFAARGEWDEAVRRYLEKRGGDGGS